MKRSNVKSTPKPFLDPNFDVEPDGDLGFDVRARSTPVMTIGKVQLPGGSTAFLVFAIALGLG